MRTLLLAAALLLGSLPGPADAAVLPSATDMLLVMNELRYATGAPTVPADPRLVTAAQNHATYNVLNGTSGHYETAGRPGYTGYVAQDRARAVGFTGPFVSEVATGTGDVLDGVRKLWDAPYHRRELMHPNTRLVGWGRAGEDRYQVVGNVWKDYAIPTVDVVRSPARGMTGVPTSWSGHESPSPVRPGSSGPYGYPVMLVYGGYKTVDVRGVSLHHNGSPLSIFISPQHYTRDYAVIVPDRPLPAGKIDVRFDLTVSGRWLTEEWSFYTGGAAPASAAPAPAPPAPTGFHSAWVTQSSFPTVSVGETATVSVAFRNTGGETWQKGTATEARLGIVGDDESYARMGMAVSWPLASRPAAQDLATVAPGASTTFTFQVKGTAPGAYLIRLRPVIDGVTWMEDQGVYMVVTVR